MSLSRELSFRLPMQRGEDVRSVQQALIRAGALAAGADGIFGPLTRDAVLRFQRQLRARNPAIAVDGIVGRDTWSALFADRAAARPAPGLGVEAPLAAAPDWRALLRPFAERLREEHGPPIGAGSRRWRLTTAGVLVAGHAAPPRTQGPPMTAAGVWMRFRAPLEKCAAAYGVPVELLVATACTESRGRAEATRQEPGYVDDATTPHRVSPGLMQTLISTAREALGDPAIDRAALLDPEVSIRAAAAYIRGQATRRGLPTLFDPPLVAIAYNAGSLRPALDPTDPWGLVQTARGSQRHADIFVEFFNDCVALFAEEPGGRPGPNTPSFRALPAGGGE